MSRLTISLTKAMHQHISMLAVESNTSLSHIANQMLQIGMRHWTSNPPNPIEPYCQQLLIQMSALIKNMAAESLGLKQADFEALRQASLDRYNEIMTNAHLLE